MMVVVVVVVVCVMPMVRGLVSMASIGRGFLHIVKRRATVSAAAVAVVAVAVVAVAVAAAVSGL